MSNNNEAINNSFVDLHVHSNYSDGTDSVEELINKAKQANLKAIALTDHDTIEGIPHIINAAKGSEIEIVPGVEISTQYQTKEVHIVGLFIDYNNDNLINELEAQRQLRTNKNKLMCEKFQEAGIPVYYEELEKKYPGSVLTRAHFADYLVSIKAVGDKNEAFDRYLGDGKPMFVNRHKIDPANAIKIIHSAGGIAILAHPILYHLGNEAMNELVRYLCNNGLDGIEQLYSTYTPQDERYILTLAKDYNLLLSGGSDYHGLNKPKISLGKGYGKLAIPYSYYENMKEYIKNK